MFYSLYCIILVLSASSIRDVLFATYNVDKALEIDPQDGEDSTYKFFLLKRFKNNTKDAVISLLSGENTSTHVRLMLARIAAHDSLIKLPIVKLLSIFVYVSTEISDQYLENRYNFSDPASLHRSSESEVDDILTTIWSRDSLVVDKFFLYIYQNKIKPDNVIPQLEFLVSHKEKRAYGMLGDIHYYGLGTPVDLDKALEYYMAGKSLKNHHSLVGIGRILLAEPFNDVEQATKLFDKAISLKKTPEALYQRHLLFIKSMSPHKDKLNSLFYNEQITTMLQEAAISGYLPAVNAITCYNARLKVASSSFPSFLSITQYAPFLLETYSKAYKAYMNKEYRKSLMLYLYLNEFKLDIATKNAIYILENHDVFPDQKKILFDLYFELASTNKKYYKYIGDCYYNGVGVEKSLSLAFGYYLSSAMYSDESLYNVAYMFESGEGVPKNLGLAYKHISIPFKKKSSYLVVLYGKLRICVKMIINGDRIVWNPYFMTFVAILASLASLFYLFSEKHNN